MKCIELCWQQDASQRITMRDVVRMFESVDLQNSPSTTASSSTTTTATNLQIEEDDDNDLIDPLINSKKS